MASVGLIKGQVIRTPPGFGRLFFPGRHYAPAGVWPDHPLHDFVNYDDNEQCLVQIRRSRAG